jgi:hypothetical protein
MGFVWKQSSESDLRLGTTFGTPIRCAARRRARGDRCSHTRAENKRRESGRNSPHAFRLPQTKRSPMTTIVPRIRSRGAAGAVLTP